jgi:hypothetical protein
MNSRLRKPRSRIGADRSALAAARAFYCDALGGRQMRRMQLGDGSSMFRFLIGEELVTTGPGVADDRVTLVVDDALAIAERCWDAGFEVRVRGSADATTIVVIDPFDRELEVISATTPAPGRASSRAAAPELGWR